MRIFEIVPPIFGHLRSGSKLYVPKAIVERNAKLGSRSVRCDE